jgi:hypothetical protein
MNTKPLRGPKYRSRAFQEYLLEQSPERAEQILAAEAQFTRAQSEPHGVAAALCRDYEEQMRGPRDGPADDADGMSGARVPWIDKIS